MRYFLLNSIVFIGLLASCNTYRSGLQPMHNHPATVHMPQFTNSLYGAYVDITTHHFSGLLFIKKMPDSSTRVIFTNEMGVKFFDFGYTHDHHFVKYYILPKMDKKIVVNELKRTLGLIVIQPDLSKAKTLKDSLYHYTKVPNKKGNIFYVSNKEDQLVRIEKASKRKEVVEVTLKHYTNNIPDSIDIIHKNYKFNILLRKTAKTN